MLGGTGAHAAQLTQHLPTNPLRRSVTSTAATDPMAHSSDRSETDLLVEPIDQQFAADR